MPDNSKKLESEIVKDYGTIENFVQESIDESMFYQGGDEDKD